MGVRRLPVYLLIDCSESMIGSGIESVRRGLSTMLARLRSDPHALESVYLSVITFASRAKVAVPLTSLIDFQEPKLTVAPGTSLGAALLLLVERIRTEVVKTSQTTKGDYRPLVLLLTDGQPTDDWRGPLSLLGVHVKPRPANIYAIGCGEDVDFSVLQCISDVVLSMDDMEPESFGKLFVWLTASVALASREVGGTGGGIKLDTLPDNVKHVTVKAPSLEGMPSRQIFLRVQCSANRSFYLVRYRLDPGLSCYRPVQAHRLSELETGNEEAFGLPDIPSHFLDGIVGCPWCENPGAGVCSFCQTIFCTDPRKREVSCPGCGRILEMETGRHAGSFNVRQSQG